MARKKVTSSDVAEKAGVSQATVSMVLNHKYNVSFSKEVVKKVEEELEEFHAEKDLEKKEMELGDVFFSLVNYARISGINPDSALERTNNKFITRFQKMENLALNKNLKLENLSLEEMDLLWEEAKIGE